MGEVVVVAFGRLAVNLVWVVANPSYGQVKRYNEFSPCLLVGLDIQRTR